MKLRLLVFFTSLCFLFLFQDLSAQYRRNCSTMDHLAQQIESNPMVKYRMRDVEIQTDENIRAGRRDMLGVVTIPVVVHVVYNNASQNISDQQVMSQIRVLNEDFGRRNPDKRMTPRYFEDLAVNAQLQFQLANRDPFGNPTNGITRTATSRRMFSPSDNAVKYSAMGGVDSWDSRQYLNIWVCNLGNGMLGYAQFPGGGAFDTDGVVIGYKFFGTEGTVVAPFDKGRTCTHEVGHWLNLKHIWGDGPCEVDDHVRDTPPANDAHYGCVTQATSCDGGPAMVSNFMDYTDDACMNMFTFGQAERMRSLFNGNGFRSSLLRSQGIAAADVPVAATAPELINATEVTETSARLSWSPARGADAYQARFRVAGTEEWASKAFTRTFVNATQLRRCTDYEFQIASIVDGETSEFSSPKVFRTMGCEEETPIAGVSNTGESDESDRDYPTRLYISGEVGDRVQLNWNKVVGAASYKVQYKAAGSRQVYAKTLPDNFVSVSNLRPGQRYFYRVRAEFGSFSGPYSEVSSFVAGGGSSARMVSKSVRQQDYFVISQPPGEKIALIDFELSQPTELLLEIEDDRGQLVESYDPFTLRPNDPIEIDLDRLYPGSYRMIITDEEGFNHAREFVVR
jgi:hypothetical protein